MRIQVVECDRCGDRGKGVLTYLVPVGREPDPSGNGYVTEREGIDLCLRCAGELLDADRCMAVKKERGLA